jgi:PilZ domain
MTHQARLHRRRVLKSGKIIFNDGQSVIDCTVRNMSEHGAHLRVPTVIGVPGEFDLLMSDGSRFPCRVVRLEAEGVGVQFL